ncbi:MAG: hypothetical protein IJ870_01590 [Alphaproteobacteria bacterium]|nr:hypothetical protein [Alphaproteobacteria bacterium]
MADDLNQNAEFGGKHKDEEDPLLVAQRYLNIYHQIHIFNKVRQKEFDDSLLALPSDIRILLSTLPGGSVLLEHINEVEEKRGIVSYDDLMPNNKNTSSKKSKNTKKSMKEELEEETKQNNAQGGNVNISNNVLKLLRQSEEKHEKDMKALTSAFLQSQENIANILKEVLLTKATSGSVSSEMPAEQKIQGANGEASAEIPDQTVEQTLQAKEDNQTSKPKLFSFTKKLFSHKNASAQSDEQNTFPYVDNTPVSLDDIADAPVALNQIDDTPSFKEDRKSDDIEPTVAKTTADAQIDEIAGNDDADWDWEYVDDEKADDQTSDDEWEYVEEPIDEEPNSDADTEWEYFEEPVKEPVKEPLNTPAQMPVKESNEVQSVEQVTPQVASAAMSSADILKQYTQASNAENAETEDSNAQDISFAEQLPADENFVYDDPQTQNMEYATYDAQGSNVEGYTDGYSQEQNFAYDDGQNIVYEPQFEYADSAPAEHEYYPAQDNSNEIDQLFDQFLAAGDENVSDFDSQDNSTYPTDDLEKLLNEDVKMPDMSAQETAKETDTKAPKKHEQNKNKNKKK